ncbi:MAG: flgK [Burkholderiaceae bacterium]|nr:flgK [Burkholderiaceae bacterium]
MPNILNIGQTALLAAQVGIATTGHNISNASVPGYNRQEVIQGAVAGQAAGFGYIGKGTEVLSIKRVYSEYLTNQVSATATSKSRLDTYYAQVKQIDNMLSDSSVGLTPALTDFFNSVNDLSSDPSSSSTRQSLLSDAQALVARFQSQASQLNEIGQGVNESITSTVTQINAYTKEIAELNTAIEAAYGQNDGQAPNDLLDQRDQKIAELSELVKVSVVKQNNTYNVYIGNGQPLVVGKNTFDLSVVQSPSDPNKIEVGYQNSGASFIMDGTRLGGGSLAGLLEFRSQTLEPAQNELGRIATTLASTFNAQHALGQDLKGALGGAFFSVGTPQVYPNGGNDTSAGANAEVSASVTNASALTTSDYELKRVGTNYVLTRLSDKTELASTTWAAAQAAAAGEGFSFSVDSGTIAAGDSFLIKPTANGASGIGVAITDTNKIAAAAPIAAKATTTNTGTGKISAGVANSPLNTNLQQPVTITFTSATAYTVTGTGIPAGTTGTYDPAAGATLNYNGWTVQITGSPAMNDSFTVGPNTSGTGDNRNALLLGNLQTSKLIGGTTTYQGAYSKLVNMVGNKTSEMEVTSKAAKASYTQAVAAQQEQSGVNLDEEAANLLRYQQAYQAAAKVMQAADEMFKSLLGITA